jgi:hypothetical protein
MTVSAFTTPENFDMAASTVTIAAVTSRPAGAVILTFTLAVISMLPAASILTVAPLECERDGAAGRVVEGEGVAALGFEHHLFAAGGVVEAELVAAAGGDRAHVVGAVHGLGRSVDAVPEGADHHRPARVAGGEGDQHLVIHLGDEPGAPVAAGHQGGEAGPGQRGGAVGLLDEGQLDLHAALVVRVLHVGDQRRIDAVEARALVAACGGEAGDHEASPRSGRWASNSVR